MSSLDVRVRTATRGAYVMSPHMRPLRTRSSDPFAIKAQKVRDAICRKRELTGGGSYVLANAEGQLYVIAEGTIFAERLVRRHIAWLVGLYASNGTVCPPIDAISDDLKAHYEDLSHG